MINNFILIMLLLLYPPYTSAAYIMTPTPEYLRYIASAQVSVIAISLILLTTFYYHIVKFLIRIRKWILPFRLPFYMSLYLTLSSLILYIFVYFFSLPHIGSIVNYNSPVMLLYIGILIIHPFSWVGFGIAIVLNRYVLTKFLKIKKISDLFIYSFLQLPIIGALIFYLVTQIYYKLIPFTGTPYLN